MSVKIRITYPTGKAITWNEKDWDMRRSWHIAGESQGRRLATIVAEALDEAGKVEIELLQS